MISSGRLSPFAPLSLAVLLALAVPARAADSPAPPPPPPAPSMDVTTASKGDYMIDPDHTNVIFEVNHLGFSTFIGRFDKTEGTLTLKPKNIERSKVSVTIDVGSLDTKVAKLDEHLKTADFFDAATYPQITFKSTKVEKLTDTTGRITGDLTLHGVTKPVTLDVTFRGTGQHPMTKKGAIGFGGTTTIKRSEFGLTKFVPFVGDDVTIIIETEFHQS